MEMEMEVEEEMEVKVEEVEGGREASSGFYREKRR